MELVYMSADNHSPELRTDKDLVVPSDSFSCVVAAFIAESTTMHCHSRDTN